MGTPGDRTPRLSIVLCTAAPTSTRGCLPGTTSSCVCRWSRTAETENWQAGGSALSVLATKDGTCVGVDSRPGGDGRRGADQGGCLLNMFCQWRCAAQPHLSLLRTSKV